MKPHLSKGAIVSLTFIAFVVIVGGIMMIISLHEGTKKDADTSTDTSGMPAIARR